MSIDIKICKDSKPEAYCNRVLLKSLMKYSAEANYGRMV